MREHSLRFAHAAPGTRPVGDGHLLSWRGPALVGVLNVTPDSFSDGGSYDVPAAAVAHGRALSAAGALMLDIGGESTRPGATPISVAEEVRRVLPVVERLAADKVHLISVDTRRPDVAREALRAGAHMINDVGGLRDSAMVEVVAEAAAPAMLMHMRGSPATMQDDPSYRDVVAEVEAFLMQRAAESLAAGVCGVIVDPGIGFGKRHEDNLALLRNVERLADSPYPLMIGASRKGFLGRIAGVAQPSDRDPASVAAHLFAARQGAALLRVHDVAAHRQALAVWAALGG